MFDLYQAQDNATYRQSELNAAIAEDRLARAAQAGDPSSASERTSPVHRIVVAASDVLASVGGAFAAIGRPHRV